VALQILAYLNEHPDAQDTQEGIAEWWLLEPRVRRVMTEVNRAIGELVALGFMLRHQGHDRHIHYRLNPRKRAEAVRVLSEARRKELPGPSQTSDSDRRTAGSRPARAPLD
jgi:hypothetical protein